MERSPLATEHERAGGRLGASGEAGVLTYGDVPGEYRAALEGAALFDATTRGLVVVRGEDRATFLHRLLANEVRGLRPGQANENLLLSSKGKVRFAFRLFATDGEILLSTTPGEAARLAEALEVYHFAESVSLEDASASHAPLALVGPRARDAASRALGREPPSAPGAHSLVPWEGLSVRCAVVAEAGSWGLVLDAGPEGASPLWEALRRSGARPAGRVAHDSLRVEAGEADPRADVDENVYPQEAGLERAISLDKGCYVGQEVVAKIDTYGGLNKRLLGLELGHDDPVPRGTRLHLEEQGRLRELGLITSWAYSFALDGGLALAYVKRRHQEPGTELLVGVGPARGALVELPVRPGAIRGGLNA